MMHELFDACRRRLGPEPAPKQLDPVTLVTIEPVFVRDKSNDGQPPVVVSPVVDLIDITTRFAFWLALLPIVAANWFCPPLIGAPT
jgi:hypothetical protein